MKKHFTINIYCLKKKHWWIQPLKLGWQSNGFLIAMFYSCLTNWRSDSSLWVEVFSFCSKNLSVHEFLLSKAQTYARVSCPLCYLNWWTFLAFFDLFMLLVECHICICIPHRQFEKSCIFNLLMLRSSRWCIKTDSHLA